MKLNYYQSRFNNIAQITQSYKISDISLERMKIFAECVGYLVNEENYFVAIYKFLKSIYEIWVDFDSQDDIGGLMEI